MERSRPRTSRAASAGNGTHRRGGRPELASTGTTWPAPARPDREARGHRVRAGRPHDATARRHGEVLRVADRRGLAAARSAVGAPAERPAGAGGQGAAEEADEGAGAMSEPAPDGVA